MLIPSYPHQILILTPLYHRNILKNCCQAPMAMPAMHMVADWEVCHITLAMWYGAHGKSLDSHPGTQAWSMWGCINPNSERNIIASERRYYGSWIMMACGPPKHVFFPPFGNQYDMFSHLWRFKGRTFGLNHLNDVCFRYTMKQCGIGQYNTYHEISYHGKDEHPEHQLCWHKSQAVTLPMSIIVMVSIEAVKQGEIQREMCG